MKKTRRISSFDLVNNALVVMITLVMIYPLYFCVIASFSDPREVSLGNTLVWVKGFTLDSYINIIHDDALWTAYLNTVFYTLFGTLYDLFLTIPVAYVLSKKHLPGRVLFAWYFFLTMYISGGMIPSYLLIKNLELINNPLVMIVGVGVNAYNMIVARQYFSNSIPPDLFEAAYIDGAGEWKSFTKIAIPLAKPIVAVLALYYGVRHWNSYYTGLLYLHKEKYFSLQQVLRKILLTSSEGASMADSAQDFSTIQYYMEKARIAQGMKYSTIFVACVPLLIAYPFVQKYFTKGVMIGSVKG